MRRLFVLVTLASIAVYACSESTDGAVPDASSGQTDGGAASSADGSTAQPGSDAKAPLPDQDATISASAVLINEISGGDEWVELVNSGSAAADISGWTLADRDKNDGGPKLSEAVTFPAGTILSPKAYALVRGGGLDAGKTCPDGGQAYCFNAEFGISNKNGEVLFLVDKSAIVGQVVYPPDASSGSGTWCRLPNADKNGAFGPCTETPGAPNQAQ